MSNQRKSGFATLAAGASLACALAVPGSALAQTTYGVALLSDFSGPYADIMPMLGKSREAVLDWWNTEVGAKLGVKLNYKNFDTRYDAAQTASLWPGIKSELNPIAVLGLGGPDVAALGQRLPDDGVALFMSTAAYGYAWKPDSWIINPRPTYAHEHAAAFKWMKAQRGGSQPLKVGIISSEASPAYVDIARGSERYAKENPSEVQLLEVVFTEVQPTDLTTQVRRLVRGGVEVISIQTNTAAVVATKRALQALNAKVPVITSSHNGLPASGKAAGGLGQMEGDFEAYGMAIASDEDTPARRFYEKLKNNYKLAAPWNVLTLMGMSQGLYSVRVIEHAIRKNGAQNLTGAKVREALFAEPVTTEETFGTLPTLKFAKQAPFPIEGLKVNIATIKNGKYVIAATNVDTPAVNKW
ncbi:MAG: ABC transporter substrate-binding protein [Burkholderiaceae bacterium]|nr:ABC transporter substrate-binding protein [Burkholderiaceae bacterium]